jgi:hypothetical protein
MATAALHALPPAGTRLLRTAVAPAAAMTVGAPATIGKRGFLALPVRGVAPGRVSVTLEFVDADDAASPVLTTTISYFVLPPLDAHVATYGQFSAEVGWCPARSEPATS